MFRVIIDRYLFIVILLSLYLCSSLSYCFSSCSYSRPFSISCSAGLEEVYSWRLLLSGKLLLRAIFFFWSWGACYVVRGGALDIHQGWAIYLSALQCCMWGMSLREGTVSLVLLCVGFQSLLPLPTSKLDPSDAASWVGRFGYVLGSCGSPQGTLL